MCMELYICKTKEARTIDISWKHIWHKKRTYSLNQRISFLKQLHLILSSGISILNGVALLESRVDNQLAGVCRQLQLHLKAGKTLTAAMQLNPEFFPPLVITLVYAGESSGELPEVLEALIQYYSKQKALKGFIAKTLIYPCCLVLAAIDVLLFFLIYVLPLLAATYTAMQAKPTQLMLFVLQISSVIKDRYLVIPIVLTMLCYLVYNSRQKLGDLILKLRWFRQSYQLMTEARFCKLLALLLNSGISITEAVEIAGTTITIDKMQPKLQLLEGYLQRGIDISTSINHSQGLFTPLTEELLTMGASTGYLPQMLEEAAKIAEDALQERLEMARELLAPMLLLVAAMFTSGIVYIAMSPLFDLFTLMPEY